MVTGPYMVLGAVNVVQPGSDAPRRAKLRRQLELTIAATESSVTQATTDRAATASPVSPYRSHRPIGNDMPARTDAARYRLGQPPQPNTTGRQPNSPGGSDPPEYTTRSSTSSGWAAVTAPRWKYRTTARGLDRRAASRTPGSVRPPGSAAYSDLNPRPRIRCGQRPDITSHADLAPVDQYTTSKRSAKPQSRTSAA